MEVLGLRDCIIHLPLYTCTCTGNCYYSSRELYKLPFPLSQRTTKTNPTREKRTVLPHSWSFTVFLSTICWARMSPSPLITPVNQHDIERQIRASLRPNARTRAPRLRQQRPPRQLDEIPPPKGPRSLRHGAETAACTRRNRIPNRAQRISKTTLHKGRVSSG